MNEPIPVIFKYIYLHKDREDYRTKDFTLQQIEQANEEDFLFTEEDGFQLISKLQYIGEEDGNGDKVFNDLLALYKYERGHITEIKEILLQIGKGIVATAPDTVWFDNSTTVVEVIEHELCIGEGGLKYHDVSPGFKTLNQQVKSLKDKIAGLELKNERLYADNCQKLIDIANLKMEAIDTKHEAIEANDIIVELKAEQDEARTLETLVRSITYLNPNHPMYKSIREDIKGSLARLKKS